MTEVAVYMYSFKDGPLDKKWFPMGLTGMTELPAPWFSHSASDGAVAVYQCIGPEYEDIESLLSRIDTTKLVTFNGKTLPSIAVNYVYREDSQKLWNDHKDKRCANHALSGPYELSEVI